MDDLNYDPDNYTPCGYEPKDMPCSKCKQHGCKVFNDPEWMKYRRNE